MSCIPSSIPDATCHTKGTLNVLDLLPNGLIQLHGDKALSLHIRRDCLGIPSLTGSVQQKGKAPKQRVSSHQLLVLHVFCNLQIV